MLYVQRWLKAPLQHTDGSVVPRGRGTPQGSAISPLLANLFMHYAFDTWMARRFPTIRFERYCDDVVVHCVLTSSLFVRDSIARRLADCRLEVHPDKTRIVYCKDSNRTSSNEHERFDYLGYTFRPRLAVSKTGARFVSFSPGVSRDAQRAMGVVIRAWRINRRRTLEEFAAIINPIVRGWLNYYGRFYRSQLKPVLRRINAYLVRWAMNTYKRLRGSPHRARQWLVGHGTTTLFAALDVATGKVTEACYPRHRHEEFLRFLQRIAKAYPRRHLHIVLDNFGTHKHPEVRRWLEKHPRIHLHFTPTGAS